MKPSIRAAMMVLSQPFLKIAMEVFEGIPKFRRKENALSELRNNTLSNDHVFTPKEWSVLLTEFSLICDSKNKIISEEQKNSVLIKMAAVFLSSALEKVDFSAYAALRQKQESRNTAKLIEDSLIKTLEKHHVSMKQIKTKQLLSMLAREIGSLTKGIKGCDNAHMAMFHHWKYIYTPECRAKNSHFTKVVEPKFPTATVETLCLNDMKMIFNNDEGITFSSKLQPLFVLGEVSKLASNHDSCIDQIIRCVADSMSVLMLLPEHQDVIELEKLLQTIWTPVFATLWTPIIQSVETNTEQVMQHAKLKAAKTKTELSDADINAIKHAFQALPDSLQIALKEHIVSSASDENFKNLSLVMSKLPKTQAANKALLFLLDAPGKV